MRGGGVLSLLERGLWRGCAPPQKKIHCWSSKSLVFLQFECYFCKFVLFWDNLSGSIALGNRENLQDPNGRIYFFNVLPYKSTVLFLVLSFNTPLLPRRPTPK